MREMPKKSLAEEIREVKPQEKSNGFVNIENIGLRRSPRIREKNQNKSLQSKSMLYKATKAAVLFAMTLVYIHNASCSHAKSYHSMNVVKCKEMLNTNLEGTQNSINPIGQVLTSISVSDNEVYTFSEMKK